MFLLRPRLFSMFLMPTPLLGRLILDGPAIAFFIAAAFVAAGLPGGHFPLGSLLVLGIFLV